MCCRSRLLSHPGQRSSAWIEYAQRGRSGRSSNRCVAHSMEPRRQEGSLSLRRIGGVQIYISRSRQALVLAHRLRLESPPRGPFAARSWADCIASVGDQGEDVVVRVGVIESSRRVGAKASARSVGPPSSRRRWAASSRRSLSLGLIWPSAPRSCRASTRAARLASRSTTVSDCSGGSPRASARACAHVGHVPLPACPRAPP